MSERNGNVPATHIRPRVVVVGAGFGGLSVVQQLANKDVEVLLVDKNNYHGFWPLLYQVATAGLEPESIAYPVRAIIRKYRNVNFLLAEVRGVDFENRRLLTDFAPIEYDYLVLAAGSANNYFGNDSLADTTIGLKDVTDALRLRNRVLLSFEAAVRETDPERRKALMTFVVVGGGPTGVELAGAFTELIRHVFYKEYPTLRAFPSRVVLLEASKTILSNFSDSLQKKAIERLKKMGVEVRLNVPLDTVEGMTVKLKDGSTIEASTVVWSAGIRGALLNDVLGVKLGRGFRVPVTPTLNLPDHPEVFCIGDMAYLEGYKPKVPYPQVAPVAMQQGERAAENILAHIRNAPTKKFRYFDKGSMATIGRRAAVLEAFGIRLTGYLAWVGWLFVHLITLIGFRNRLVVLTNWIYNYFTYDRAARLVLEVRRDDVNRLQDGASADESLKEPASTSV